MDVDDATTMAQLTGGRELTVGYSGAFVHVLPAWAAKKMEIPGTRSANTLKVGTANGTVTPPWKCDAMLPVGMLDGTVEHVPMHGCLKSSWTIAHTSW